MRRSVMTRCGRWAEFRFAGAVERDAILNCFRDVHADCVRDGLDGALVDLSGTTGTLGALDRIELARTISEDWTRTILLAVVVNEGQHLPERPAQLAAQNRGMRTREFTEVASAEAWLRSVLDPQAAGFAPCVESRT